MFSIGSVETDTGSSSLPADDDTSPDKSLTLLCEDPHRDTSYLSGVRSLGQEEAPCRVRPELSFWIFNICYV